ncbi:MAG: hypothetical protein GC149_02370 [Gammaproteobacteria bacterium]|nr:hypothetical protein [Gammaproteobacteria bacterium]
MPRLLPAILLFTVTGLASAGMMGGMNGMMGSTPPPEPPPQNAAPAIHQGYDLTQEYCAQCHQLPAPSQHTPAEWPHVVARMQAYMQQQHRHVPNAREQQLILDYLDKSNADK